MVVIEGPRPGGSNFLVAKGIPKESLRALPRAFAKTWKDPGFAKEYMQVTGDPADPVKGEDIHRALQQIPKEPEIKKTCKRIVGAGPLLPGRWVIENYFIYWELIHYV